MSEKVRGFLYTAAFLGQMGEAASLSAIQRREPVVFATSGGRPWWDLVVVGGCFRRERV